MREERTANASSNFGKQNVESIDEFDAETVELFFVPFVRFANFLYRAIRNPQPVRHVPRKIRVRTSSQGDPASGSASNSARRRSSSAFSSSDIGTASGTAAMLSQINSTRRIRSAMGSSRIWATEIWLISCSVSLLKRHELVQERRLETTRRIAPSKHRPRDSQRERPRARECRGISTLR